MIAPIVGLLIACSGSSSRDNGLPAGFANLSDIDASIQLDIRYFTSNNFIGRPIDGYFAPRCILTEDAANALGSAQRMAISQGYSLKVYDCYRPQRAVDDFVSWASDPDDILAKHRFYPSVAKDQLFAQGYIASRSGHSRGSTVDLTLVPMNSRQPAIDPFANRYDCRFSMARRYPDNTLDMGTGYDCFDPRSNTDNPETSPEAAANRATLKMIMESAGFENYELEWWHYTLINAPFQNEYFNFSIGL
jgi:D-alanyl-D-alanine dipeptidase